MNDEINGKKDLSLILKFVPDKIEILNNNANNFQRVNIV